VTDNGSPNLTTNQTFEVVAREINAAPMLTLPANQAFNEETIFNATATATESDVPTNALTFELVSGPSGLTVSPAGAIQWTPSEAQGSNSYTVIVRVTDNNPGAFNSQQLSTTNSFDLTVNEVNVAPNLTVPPNQVITEENLLGVSASATDPDVPANPLTFALISPPPGMTIEPNSGAISWTPDESQGSNSYVITVTVADNNPSAANALQLSETNSFIVTVTESNRPPVLILPANQTVNELAALNTNATATDLDLPANSLTFALVSGPSNLTVSAGGEIHWTPAENHGPTTNMVFISVTDGNSLAVNATSLSITGSFDIVVEEVNSAPVLADMSDRIVNPGRTISFIAMAIDADQPTNTLAFSLMNPPIGATIDPASGAFDWRPGVALADTTNVVQVRVQDNGTPGLSDAKSFTVIVNALAPVVLTQVSRPNGQFRFRVSGTEGPDYVVQASTNLTDWTDIATVPAPVAPFQVDDDNAATFSNRFYRVRLQP
jgi:plastocyanin